MRNKELNTLNEKKKLDESYKKNKSEQEKELIKLNKECDELNEKMSDYNEEKPKLLKKAKEPKSEIDRMKKNGINFKITHTYSIVRVSWYLEAHSVK